jgi:hypothetical protein
MNIIYNDGEYKGDLEVGIIDLNDFDDWRIFC